MVSVLWFIELPAASWKDGSRMSCMLALFPIPRYCSAIVCRESSAFRWVAELRDLWTDHHYNPYPFWRSWVEAHLERTVLQTAVGLVTVSEPLKENLPKEIPETNRGNFEWL